MPTVTRHQLRCGDLLITKYEGTLTHKVISFGSFLFGGNFNSSNYVHAQIVCRDGGGGDNLLNRTGATEIAESHAEGLHIEAPHSPATVFRLKAGEGLSGMFIGECARSAAEVAIELTGRQKPNDSFARYNFVGAARSLFLTTRVTSNVKSQLNEIESGTSHDRLFCSQFVVVCYQVAILRMVKKGHAPQCLLPFELDAKSMEPAYLVSYLRRNPGHWLEVGEFDPTVN